MLRKLIAFSLNNAALVLLLAALLLGYAAYQVPRMAVDVFPELNAPTVVILTEAGGLAADEVEQYVTFPVESGVNGLPGVRRVRSGSAMSLSIVWVEFDWGTDIYRARQVVSEGLDTVREQLPEQVHTEIAPITGITGEIMLLSLSSPDGSVNPLELRAFAEFDLRQRLLSVSGVAQVVAIGGELPEYQVNVRTDLLQLYDLTMADVVEAAKEAHTTAPAGYLPNVRGVESALRQTGRVRSERDVSETIIKYHAGSPVTIGQVADVRMGPTPPRGTGAQGFDAMADQPARSQPAVVLGVKKAPFTNTIAITRDIDRVLDDIDAALPAGMQLDRHVMRQADFINISLDNLKIVLRDAAIFVSVVLILFLLNVRTTIITLTAIPLSMAMALLFMAGMNMTINVMTLGGLAIAIGELVDDAIIDVENVYRRLRENAALPAEQRRARIRVIFDASNEIRSSVVFATVIIVIVFIPLLFLQGIEGRFFRPMGIAYIVSILASLLVALTVVPAMCRYLLRGRMLEGAVKSEDAAPAEASSDPSPLRGRLGGGDSAPDDTGDSESKETKATHDDSGDSESEDDSTGVHPPPAPPSREGGRSRHRDGFLVRWLKRAYEPSLRIAIKLRWLVLALAVVATAASLWLGSTFGTDFLPDFNEGTFTIFIDAPPGTSLTESDRMVKGVDRRLAQIEGVRAVVRRTGRAERDEHAHGVNRSEIEVAIEPGYSKDDIKEKIDHVLADLPGVTTEVGAPIGHRLSHVLSGTQAAIAINVFGDDLAELRSIAQQIELALQEVPGTRDVLANREATIESLPIRYRRLDLQRFGLTPAAAAAQVEAAYNGVTVASINDGIRLYDLVVRLRPEERQSYRQVKQLLLRGRDGAHVRLSEVADIGPEYMPLGIQRENAQRKAVISLNVADGYNLGHVVESVREKVEPITKGHTVTFGGQFEAQESASRTIYIAGAFVCLIILVLLSMAFGSTRAALLVMVNLPLALIGGIVAIFITAEGVNPFANFAALFGAGTYVAPVISIASMVGFVTLFGIAVRNGLLLVNHYAHLMRYEGKSFDDAVIQGSMERLVPILMTALTAVLGLLPLALARGEPGSELLAPLAIVVLGGLVTSTFLNLIVVPAGYYMIFRNHPIDAQRDRIDLTDSESKSPSLEGGVRGG